MRITYNDKGDMIRRDDCPLTAHSGTCSVDCWVWENQPESNDWQTSYGANYWFEDFGPKEQDWKFCPFCGKRIEIK